MKIAVEKPKATSYSGKNIPKPLFGEIHTGRQSVLLILGIALYTSLIYLRVFHNQLTNRDDLNYVLDNPYIKSLSINHLRDCFTRYYMGNYHPLSMLCYSLGYQISGNLPWSYQLINLILHLCNTILVYYFVSLLIKSVKTSWSNTLLIPAITATLFGIHTIQVESVAWISENKNVLYTFFFLFALIQYIKYSNNNTWKSYRLTFLFFMASLLSKATAVTLPFCMLAVDYYFKRKLLSKKVILEKLPFILLSVLFGIVAIKAQGENVNAGLVVGNPSLFERFGIAGYGLIHYILNIILPVKLSAFYEYPAGFSKTFPKIFYVYLVSAFAGLTLLLWKGRNSRIFIFCLMFFLINLAPVIQFLPVGDAVMADRYAYVPSIAFFLYFAYLFSRFTSGKNRIWPLILLVFYLLFLSEMTFQRIGVWKNSVTLWTDVLQKSGFSYESEGWLARSKVYNNSGHFENALRDADKYLIAHPKSAMGYFQRGFARYSTGDFKNSLNDFDMSEKLELDLTEKLGLDLADLYICRAQARSRTGDFSGALSDFDKVIALDSMHAVALAGRADVNMYLKKFTLALHDLNRLIGIEPDNASAYNNRGLAKRNLGDDTGAIEDYSHAILMDPHFMLAYQNRVDAYFEAGEYEKAIADLNTIISHEPMPEAYYYLGSIYMKLGNTDRACINFRYAKKLGYSITDEQVIKLCGL